MTRLLDVNGKCSCKTDRGDLGESTRGVPVAQWSDYAASKLQIRRRRCRSVCGQAQSSYKPIEGYSGVEGFVLALRLTVGNMALVLGRRGPRPETHTLLGTITQQGVRRVRLGTASAAGHLRTWASPHARPVETHRQEKGGRLPEGRGLRVAALRNLIKVAYPTMARSGERLDARVRPHFGEVVIIYPRYDRLPIDRELNHAGMVKCDFRKALGRWCLV